MPTLFDSAQAGDLHLRNRIIMAPLTRCRATTDRVPTALMAQYYQQRAGAGLIISEATSVSPMGVGYPDTPGIWTDQQVQGWQLVTDAVHNVGGLIVLQLWHVGRISHPSYLEGELPVSASAIAPEGHVSLLRPMQDYVTPRALETDEIPAIVEAYRLGAKNAQQAGFDGVEIHAANGYLIDQFLQDSTNKRNDRYGGSLENRARLLLEVTDAVISVWGAGKVGVHLAPRGDAHTMGDSNPLAIFSYVAQELGKRNIAFICTRESQGADSIDVQLKQAFAGFYIANEGFTQETAEQAVEAAQADAVAFGRAYIANPDLAQRFEQHLPLNEPDYTTFYGVGLEDKAKGYTDYPFAE